MKSGPVKPNLLRPTPATPTATTMKSAAKAEGQTPSAKKVVITQQPEPVDDSFTSFDVTPSQILPGQFDPEKLAELQERHSRRSIATVLKIHFPNLQTLGGLKPLFRVSHLFLNESHRHDGITIVSPTSYEVINERGEIVFQVVVQREKCLGLCFTCPNRFSAVLTDINGEEVLYMEGDPGCYGRNSSVKARGRLEKYGSVVQEGDCCTPDYTLLTPIGSHLLKICPQAPVNCFNICVPVEYGIFHGQYTTKVGKLSSKWHLAEDVNLLPEYFAQRLRSEKRFFHRHLRRLPCFRKSTEKNAIKMIGAAFPSDMPIQNKVLVLATLFLVKLC